MRGTVAKRIRRGVYGKDGDKNREYRKASDGSIVADLRRQMYQRRKRIVSGTRPA